MSSLRTGLFPSGPAAPEKRRGTPFPVPHASAKAGKWQGGEPAAQGDSIYRLIKAPANRAGEIRASIQEEWHDEKDKVFCSNRRACGDTNYCDC